MSNFRGLGSQRAPNNLGREVEIGPSYRCSISLNEVKASNDHQDPVSLCKIEDVISVLGDIDNKQDADMDYQVTVDFYPSLHRVLVEKKANNNFFFHGHAVFATYLIEWTDLIFRTSRDTLNHAGIYGAVYISRYPFSYERSVWRAFLNSGVLCLTHFIIAAVRWEYLFCAKSNDINVSWEQWIEFFYRGKKMFQGMRQNSTCEAIGEDDQRKGKSKVNLHSIPLNISKEGSLAAFLSLWLSRFVFPTEGSNIRPETFYMASMMAHGHKVSLAPSVLGYIYRALYDSAIHGQGRGQAFLLIHYVIGWLAEHFRHLYSGWDLMDLPHLSKYGGIPAERRSMNGARHILRGEDYVMHRPYSFPMEKDLEYLDNEDLSDEKFELLISMRSSLLPVRVGNNAYLEPYYPNRFARQFGFDQGVPSDKFCLSIPRRRQCGISEIAKAWVLILRRNTGIHFHIPRTLRMGQCTWWYCRWWVRSCIPYLGRSVKAIHSTLSKQPFKEEESNYVIKDIRLLYSNPEEVFERCPPQHNEFTGANYAYTDSDIGSENVHSLVPHFKQKKRAKHDESSHIEDVFFPLTQSSEMPPSDTCFGASSSRDEQLIDFDGSDDYVNKGFDSEALPAEPTIPPEPIVSAKTGTPSSLVPSDLLIPRPNPVLTVSASAITNSDLNEHTKKFVIECMKDILHLSSSPLTTSDISKHRADVSMQLDVLSTLCGHYKCGLAEVAWFTDSVNDLLKAQEKSLASAQVVENALSLDESLIMDLLRRDKDNLAAIDHLSISVTNKTKDFEDFKAKEAEIIAAELAIQQRRAEFEADKASFEVDLSSLKDSLKEQQHLVEEISQSKDQASVEKFHEAERAKATLKIQEEEFQRRLGALTLFLQMD
ncbi:hypothetical protein CsatB_027203 [Cannabis sativa]